MKTGPDRAELAYTLWSNCALPAILYGCEVVPLNQGTIQEIERCQTRVGKFILQIPASSSNVSTNIDCGFKPVWSAIAERVMLYASKLMTKPSSYWPKLAFQDHLDSGSTSNFLKYLNKWKTATNSFGIHPKQIRKNVKHYAIKDGRFYKLCPLCSTDSTPQLNNEVPTLHEPILEGINFYQ